MAHSSTSRHTQSGFSLIELLATLGLFGVLALVATSNLKILENPLANASYSISHYLRLVRSRAISQTLTIQVTPASGNRLVAASAPSCGAATTPMPELTLEFDDSVSLNSMSWSVCFNQRGLADDVVEFDFEYNGMTKTVEVALGGGVRIK